MARYGLPDDQIHPAIAEAWKRGQVRDIPGKLELTQKDMLRQLETIPTGWRMILASRKIGKTWLACVLMLEHALKVPGAQIIYMAPVAKNIKEPVIEIMDELLANCPMSLAPLWNTADKAFSFPSTGAKLRIVGSSSGRATTLRGAKATMLVVDECGFMEQLDSVIRSVIGPMTYRNPDAVKLMMSSAPELPGHEVIRFILDHRAKGTLVERTILDRIGETEPEITRITRELEEAIESCGGRDTTHFRREYMNELVFDTESTVIPEWHDQARVLGKNARNGQPDGTGLIRMADWPEHFVAIVGFDPGFHHHAGVVFGVIDFKHRTLVIVDEIDAVKTISSDLAPQIREKELAIWGTGTGHHPMQVFRVMDNAPDVQGEMRKEGILFAGIGKKELRSQVNAVRALVKQGRLVVQPNCKKLIACLTKATWAPRSSEDSVLKFREDSRQGPEGLGHYDLLAALVYAVARCPFDLNPFPALAADRFTSRGQDVGGSWNTATQTFNKPSAQVAGIIDAFKSQLG